MPGTSTAPLLEAIGRTVQARPFRIETWDGGVLEATETERAPTFSLSSPQALRHLVWAPGQLGLGRAYVSGGIDVDDMDRVVELLDSWQPPRLTRAAQLRLMLWAVRIVGLGRPPAAPVAELRLRGRRRSVERDARAVRHHYDVSNEFFALFLDETMTYSCAFFSRADDPRSLESAQRAKLELTCRKLGLSRGDRVLDVGCGWGSFAVHAAGQHGVHVTGITLSEPQASLARERVRDAGLSDRVEILVEDYRDLAGETFDAVASIGMVEHVGEEMIDSYARILASLVRPGGRVLNHGIARLRHTDPDAGPFSERYVFPDAAPLHLSRVLLALERAGLEPHHCEDFRADYAETLRHWAQRLDGNLEQARAHAGDERTRVWRLYLRAACNGFRSGFTSIHQVLASRPG